MQDYGTNIKVLFPAKIMAKFLETSIHREITNQDFEGDIHGTASELDIFSMGDVPLRVYTGVAMTNPDAIPESIGKLKTDQMTSWYFKIRSLEKFLSQVKDPESEQMTRLANRLKMEVDKFILALYPDVAAGNRIGTDADDATTITITATTGAFVIAGGTPATSAWVGRGIKAPGLTKRYRIKSVTNTTTGFVENDEDDVASHYDGGTITGVSYVVEAVTPVTLTKDTIYDALVDLGTKLTLAGVPTDGRKAIIPGEIHGLLQKNSMVAAPIAGTHDEVVKRGYIGKCATFDLYVSNQVAGDNTNGFHILGLSKAWATFGSGFVDSGIEDLQGDFGKAYKGLTVYGAKVVDQNRPYAAELFAKV